MAAPQKDTTYVYDQDDCKCASLTCDDCNPGPAEPISRLPMLERDMLRADLLRDLHKSLNEAWKGWQMACRFESDIDADFYMEHVVAIQGFVGKIKRIKKKSYLTTHDH